MLKFIIGSQTIVEYMRLDGDFVGVMPAKIFERYFFEGIISKKIKDNMVVVVFKELKIFKKAHPAQVHKIAMQNNRLAQSVACNLYNTNGQAVTPTVDFNHIEYSLREFVGKIA